jgi:uncharacterized protein YbjT (DUF2867 family)
MILVVGGSGDLGSRIVRHLCEAGAQVRCLVRPATDVSVLRELGVELVPGDLTDPDSLAAACRGVQTVVASATAIGRVLAGARHPSIHEVDEVGMASLVDAAEHAGVERFVYVSYAGVDSALGTPLERAKAGTERRLARSPMRRVVVRPDAFQEVHLAPLGRFDVRSGRAAVFGKGDTDRRWVATEDVAALVAAVATEADPPDIVTFGGPEAISRNEAIRIAEQASGQTFKVQRMPRAAARAGMRILARPSPAMATIFGTGLMLDLLPLTWDDSPLRDRGITPRAASEWIREQAQDPR